MTVGCEIVMCRRKLHQKILEMSASEFFEFGVFLGAEEPDLSDNCLCSGLVSAPEDGSEAHSNPFV